MGDILTQILSEKAKQDESLEQTILKNLIYNEEYTRKVLPFIRADYFADATERNIFKEIFAFVNQYKTLPTNEALIINFTESKSYGGRSSWCS